MRRLISQLMQKLTHRIIKIEFFNTKIFNRWFATKEASRVFFSAILLYMSSCISLTLATKTIGYWLFDNGFSYSHIAIITSLLHLPYSMRILFVPWLEYMKIPVIKTWGHRKTLLFLTSILNIVCVFWMSFFGMSNLYFLLSVCFLCSILSTCSETITSAFFMHDYHLDMKPHWVQGGQIGYNIGLYMTYTLLLGFSSFIPWETLYFGMIGVLVINVWCIVYLKNCTFERQFQPNLHKVYVMPMKELYKRHKEYFKPLAIFSLFYRAPDKMLAPILPLFMVSLFGKTTSAFLKTISLFGMFIGSFAWKKFQAKNPIVGLLDISLLHMCNIIFLGVMSYIFLYTDYKIISLLCIGCSGFLIKTIRTMESAAIFAYQCSLYDQKHFSAQASIGTLADKAFGDVCASISGIIKDTMGFSVFFMMSAMMVLPAWFYGRKLTKVQMKLN